MCLVFIYRQYVDKIMSTAQFNELVKLADDALDQKTKPPGSLGLLEHTAAQISAIQRTLTPTTDTAITIIFAADHGVAAEGVSAYPREVTKQMLLNFASGGAAINTICNAHNIELEVIDTGVMGDPVEGVLNYKVAQGTANFLKSPAMTKSQLDQALSIGHEAVSRANDRGINLIALGEMGIGNTTSAAAIVAAVCNVESAVTVGRGTGIDDVVLKHKADVVKKALEKHPDRTPEGILQNLGGFEIAAMCGAMLRAVDNPVAIVVDGYIATAAALCAVAIEPTVREHLLFAHRSAEPGHTIALQHLHATPLLQLDLRLGEGSGAALAIPLIRSASAILCDMATFESAGVERELA